jgi:hypothetical protein
LDNSRIWILNFNHKVHNESTQRAQKCRVVTDVSTPQQIQRDDVGGFSQVGCLYSFGFGSLNAVGDGVLLGVPDALR